MEEKKPHDNSDVSKDNVQHSATFVKGDGKSQLYRISKTALLFLSWVCLGLFNEVVGPTLPDIKARVGANYEEIGRVLAARSAGLFLGSLFGGFIIDRFTKKRDLFLAISLLISGTTICLSPHIGSLWLLGIVFHMMGHGHGLQTTGGNPSLSFLWLDRASGPFNFLHSGFGFGAAIAPLIAQPFLTEDFTTTNGTLTLNVTDILNVTAETDLTPLSAIEYPYAIVGALCYLTAILFFLFFIFLKKTPDMFIPKQQKKIAKIFDPSTCAGGDKSFGAKMFVLVFLYYMMLVGGERAYGKFVYSYARESNLSFTKTQASWLNTSYWISFTLARVVAFIVSRWIPIHILLFIQVSGTTISAILLNVFHSNAIGFWIATFTFGFFKAPLFPSGLGWINRYLSITSMLIMVVNIGSSTGGMIIQWLTGYLFEYYGPSTFLYTIMGYSLSITLIFCCMHVVGERHGDRFNRQKVENGNVQEMEDLNKTDPKI